MKLVKQIGLWIAAAVFTLMAIWSMPSISCVSAAIVAALIVPIEGWQNLLHRYVHIRIKTVAIIALVVLMIITFPHLDAVVNADAPDSIPTTAVATTSTRATHSTTTALTTTATTIRTTASTATSTSTTVPTTTTTTAHVHSFAPATCTDPATCGCGATAGEATGHHWVDATDTVPKTCSRCGATEGEPLHNPNNEHYQGHVYTGGASSKKYHYKERCAGKNSHEITWDEVSERRLTPCGKCVLK